MTRRSYLIEDIIDYSDLHEELGIIGSNSVQEEVRLDTIFQSTGKCINQFWWEILDKSDGVVDEDFFAQSSPSNSLSCREGLILRNSHLTYMSSQCREEFVF